LVWLARDSQTSNYDIFVANSDETENLRQVLNPTSEELTSTLSFEDFNSFLFNFLIGNVNAINRNNSIANYLIAENNPAIGPYLFLDNSGANWDQSTGEQLYSNDVLRSPTSSWCKFPRKIANTILMYDELREKDEKNSLGNVIQVALRQLYARFQEGYQLQLSTLEVKNLDRNVAFLADSIRQCLCQASTTNDVLIEDHWEHPFYEFFSYLINVNSIRA